MTSTSAAEDLTPPTGRARWWLLPCAALMLLYFYLYNPWLHLPPETLVAAAFKAAPIWYLAHYVGMARNFHSNGAAVGARVGLALSSLGDVCLIWRRTLFLPGVFCFALAQLGYIAGLRSWLRTYGWTEGHYKREFTLAGALSFLFVVTGIDSVVMAVCVLAYTALLFSMAYHAVQRHLAERSEGSLVGALGGICFAVSDLLIAVDKWKARIPGAEGLIMVTYYAAQAAIAYGAATSRAAQRGERGEQGEMINEGKVVEDRVEGKPAHRSASLYGD